jgi:hypothetical protein
MAGGGKTLAGEIYGAGEWCSATVGATGVGSAAAQRAANHA